MGSGFVFPSQGIEAIQLLVAGFRFINGPNLDLMRLYRVPSYKWRGGSPKSQIPVAKRLCKSSHKCSTCANILIFNFEFFRKSKYFQKIFVNEKCFVSFCDWYLDKTFSVKKVVLKYFLFFQKTAF